jgi:short-subunit dehydrogenase
MDGPQTGNPQFALEARLVSTKKGEGQTALVTGASAGIGVDLAECFAGDGYDLILCARSRSALGDVAARLADVYDVKVTPIVADLSAIGGGARLAAEIEALGLCVDVLVNNAGYGLAGAFANSDLPTQLGIIDLNDRALVELTHIFWRGMLTRRRGGVLNVASTAAFLPGPLMSIYYASKAFVLSFSEALWEEARGTGVKVSCLCPGPTVSKFRERAATGATRLAHNGRVMASAPVARLGYDGFQRNRRVVIAGTRNALMARVAQYLPRTFALRVVRNMLEPANPDSPLLYSRTHREFRSAYSSSSADRKRFRGDHHR